MMRTREAENSLTCGAKDRALDGRWLSKLVEEEPHRSFELIPRAAIVRLRFWMRNTPPAISQKFKERG
jgi:hypothetical protein